ncbi:O-antigen ligase family protein [Aliivibrio fischeri]|uniref:O-antigen ligase family protein n=1 Tax=Aliivibrio fischeri TaxID=668 RepID=UPI0007C435BB|nr:O-antigen ligase family protein [Aliivibrio fischeri]
MKSYNTIIFDCLYIVFFSFGIFSYIFKAILGFNYAYTLSILMLVTLSLVVMLVNGFKTKCFHLRIYAVIVFFILFFISTLNDDYFSLYSFLYELFKLSTFFLVLSLISRISSNGHRKIINIVIVFLLLNFFILIFQNLFGVTFVEKFGLPIVDKMQILYGRPNGLTENANVIGSFSFLSMVAFINFYEKKREFKYLIFVVLSFFIIMLSTSKTSILIALFYLSFFMNNKLIRVFAIVLIFTLASYLYVNNVYGLESKVIRYIDGFNNFEATLLVEGRIRYWIIAIQIFIENPFGLGLGTWGDFSSSFNNKVVNSSLYTKTSDSALSHYLVEQGVFLLLYLHILYRYIPDFNKKGIFFISIVLMFTTNFGFSQQIFLLGTWFVAGSIYFKESY